MTASLRNLACLLFAALTLHASAQTTPAANDALVKGVAAFKAGDYAAAIEDFRAAATADPAKTLPHVYLGTAYAYQLAPDNDSPGNIDLAHKAIEQFQQIPSTDSRYLNALREIAFVQRNIKDYDAARETELNIITLAPDDAEAHYTLGVIDWTQAYRAATNALAAEGLQDDGSGNPKMTPATCATIRGQNSATVDESIAQLEKAVELKPDYSDAMSYLNLTYRRHADFACGNASARKNDLAQADQWIQRSVAVRKARAQAPVAPAQPPQ